MDINGLDIHSTIEKMIGLKTKIWIEQARNITLDQRIFIAQKELISEKQRNVELQLSTKEVVRKLNLVEKQSTTFESNLRKYDILLSQLPSISEYANSTNQDELMTSANEVQAMAQNFLKECNLTPWFIEKKQHLHSLQEDENRLEITKRQIILLNNKIHERTALLKTHNEISMQNFCLNLASFMRNRESLQKLLWKERKLKKQYEVKILENSNLSVEETEFNDYPPTKMYNNLVGIPLPKFLKPTVEEPKKYQEKSMPDLSCPEERRDDGEGEEINSQSSQISSIYGLEDNEFSQCIAGENETDLSVLEEEETIVKPNKATEKTKLDSFHLQFNSSFIDFSSMEANPFDF